jgi:hypothetical protein
MRNESGGVSLKAIGLMCLLGVMLIGLPRIREYLYHAGLSGHWTPEDVENFFQDLDHRAGAGGTTYKCEAGTQGWDFVCDSISPEGRHRKSGIMSSAMYPIAWVGALPMNEPTPSKEEYLSHAGEYQHRAFEEGKQQFEEQKRQEGKRRR